VIARVNNFVITDYDLENRKKISILIHKDDSKFLSTKTVDKMIDEELIIQDATRLGISVDESEIEEALEHIATKQNKTASKIKSLLEKNNIPINFYKKEIEANLLWSKIISEVLKAKVRITSAEVKEFYEQKKMNLNLDKFLLAEIFIPNDKDAKLLAEKLVFELRGGKNFDETVKFFSKSPSADNAGNIGFVSENDIDKKIYAAIFRLKNGEYSAPIQLGAGYYIFKLLDKITLEKMGDDYNAVRNHLFVSELEIEAKNYLIDLRKNAFYEINKDYIKN
jgi:peptidyl-prolyl cis-trans isomerase SurA